MPWSLKRYYGTRALHFLTTSCHQREPYLGTPRRRDLLLDILEEMRQRYQFVVVGYVVMPEHLHLLISEPKVGTPSTVVQAIKLAFVRRVSTSGISPKPAQHLWMKRFYDFNVWSQSKMTEKLRYMHRNPVARGLVERPEDWQWSSFRAYACGEIAPVTINDWSSWTESIQSKVS